MKRISRDTARELLPIGIALLVLLACLPCEFVRAQTVNGAFHGTITDSTGAVIPDAKVVVRNLGTGTSREVTSDASGFYTITQIPPAHYSITASKAGFATSVEEDVQLLVNEDRAANFTLQVGQLTQQVEVKATAAALNTTNSTLGTVVGSQQVVDLPLNGRQFTEMILLTPGAAPQEAGQQASQVTSIGGGGISPSVNGQNGRQNNFTLDGGFNNEIFHNAWAISPPPDAIQEFKVQEHTVDAQFGMEPGANVNLVTKSGANAFHGDAWEFLRNDKLDAANFFDNFANELKPPYRQNQFGFTVGGPVILPGPNGNYDGRDKKTYFFGYYEGFRSTEGFTEFGNVPTAGELGGNFSDILTTTPVGTDPLGRPIYGGQIYNPYSTRQVTAGSLDPVTGLLATTTSLVRDPFQGNIVPTAMLNAQALTYLHAMYPAANYGPGGNSFPNLAVSSRETVTDDQWGVKLDHTFGNNDTLMGAFYLTNPKTVEPAAIFSNVTTLVNNARTISLNYTHLFSPTFLATIHYGYNHENEPLIFGDLGSAASRLSLLEATDQLPISVPRNGIPQETSLGSLGPRLNGTFEFAVPNGPFRSQVINADLQKISGHHTIAAGYMAFHIHSFDDGWGIEQDFDQFPTSAITGPGANASASGDGLASMLLNVPSGLFGFLGDTSANVHNVWQGAYLQDKWQASRKLTVTVGLRYDYVPPLAWASKGISGWSNNCGCLLISEPYGAAYPYANVRPRYFDPQWREFQPRLGLAYNATSKLVLRGGYATFTDHGGNLIQQTQDDRIAWPWGIGLNLVNLNRGVPNTFFSDPAPASSYFPNPLSPGIPYIFGGANNENKTPTSLQWNLGVQAQLSSSTMASVDYVGSRDNHLFVGYTDNSPTPNQMGPGAIAPRSQYPYFPEEFSYDTDIGYSTYNALDVKVERRFSRGLTFLGSYTWSHCLDVESETYSDSIPNPYNIASNYGNCVFDFTNIFSASYIYRLPFGRGMSFGGGWSGPVNAVLGGWQMGGIVSAYSGAPFSVDLAFDNANTGTGAQRADLVGNPLPSGFKQTRAAWYNPAAFAIPAPYTYGDLGRDTLRGPGHADFDFSLSKNFKFTEARYLQFRFEGFNLFNRVNFASPGGGAEGNFTNFGGAASTDVATPTFMQIYAAGPARQIQFSLKLFF